MSIELNSGNNFDGHQLIDQKSDTIFYKYMDVEGALKALQGNTFKLTNPKDFNDPLDCYEGLINYKYSKTDLKNVAKNYISPHFKGYKRAERRKIIKENFSDTGKMRDKQLQAIIEMKAKLGVCCLSEIHDNILMWSHYGEKHRGVCFGYNFKPLETEFFGLFRVAYRDKITVIDKYVSLLPAMCHWVLTKASAWAYEKEIRAVNMNKNGLEIVNPLIVNEIYYGCNISSENRLKFDNIINVNYSHANKFQMVLDENTFKLIAKKLPN